MAKQTAITSYIVKTSTWGGVQALELVFQVHTLAPMCIGCLHLDTSSTTCCLWTLMVGKHTVLQTLCKIEIGIVIFLGAVAKIK